jgi:hypothetical protein
MHISHSIYLLKDTTLSTIASLDCDTKAEGFSLMENGRELKNGHNRPVEEGKTVKESQEVKVEESQEQSEKIKKKMGKRTKEGGRKTQTEETQTG